MLWEGGVLGQTRLPGNQQVGFLLDTLQWHVIVLLLWRPISHQIPPFRGVRENSAVHANGSVLVATKPAWQILLRRDVGFEKLLMALSVIRT